MSGTLAPPQPRPRPKANPSRGARGAAARDPAPRQPAQAPIRIGLVAEDQQASRQIGAAVTGDPSLSVALTAVGMEEGVSRVQAARPTVTLVSAGLCREDPARCLARTRELAGRTRVVVMNAAPTGEELVSLIAAGSKGFVPPDASAPDVRKTIHAVAEGQGVLPPRLASVLYAELADHPGVRTPPGTKHGATRLSRREREIVELIAEGLTNKEIARRIHVATNTVKSHVHNILEKLDLHTRLQISAAHASGRIRVSADLEWDRPAEFLP